METQRVRAHAMITGVVQGVGYRAFVRREAARHHLVGWVRNLPDGRVECEVEGTPQKVEAFLKLLSEGPPLACVEMVDVRWLSPTGQDKFFEILR
ncbi:MAG: acylphosphatase [Nitrospirae bacterium]|nr:MAG: acylphosphatase [Nitrospirota bacterium]